ncbi:MAG: glycosyltransferase [Aureliella sp.]
MNLRRRVLVIARHFWPATNDDTLRLYHWVQHLRGLGAEVQVATPRWHNAWPRRIVCDGVSVQRIDYPPSHTLRMGRYSRQLGNWLAKVAGEFDAVYCDTIELEAAAVLNTPQLAHLPLMLRYAAPSAGIAMDTPASVPAKTLALCRRATTVLAADVRSQQQLLAAGLPRASIVRTAQIHGRCYDRSPEARRRARQLLSEINHDLFARGHDRVVVCPGELTREWHVLELIHELAPLIESHRALRVWVLGDGRQRGPIYEALRHEGLHRVVAMPGLFTDLEEIFQAADLCIFPAPGLGLGWLLPTAIASGVPLLASDSPEARRQLEPEADQLIYAAEQPLGLRQLFDQWLRQPAQVSASVERVRQQCLRDESPCLGVADLFLSLEASA